MPIYVAKIKGDKEEVKELGSDAQAVMWGEAHDDIFQVINVAKTAPIYVKQLDLFGRPQQPTQPSIEATDDPTWHPIDTLPDGDPDISRESLQRVFVGCPHDDVHVAYWEIGTFSGIGKWVLEDDLGMYSCAGDDERVDVREDDYDFTSWRPMILGPK